MFNYTKKNLRGSVTRFFLAVLHNSDSCQVYLCLRLWSGQRIPSSLVVEIFYV